MGMMWENCGGAGAKERKSGLMWERRQNGGQKRLAEQLVKWPNWQNGSLPVVNEMTKS
jgi:hypothetical protein